MNLIFLVAAEKNAEKKAILSDEEKTKIKEFSLDISQTIYVMTGILTVITIVGIVCLFCANDSSCNNMKKCWMSIVKKEPEEEEPDPEEA